MGEIVHTHKYEKSRKSRGESELTKERTAATRANRMRAEMLLAKSRDELIAKELVLKQASYLLVALRQRILSVPSMHARELAAIGDVHMMTTRLREILTSLLKEISHLPEQVTNPRWMDELDEQEELGKGT